MLIIFIYQDKKFCALYIYYKPLSFSFSFTIYKVKPFLVNTYAKVLTLDNFEIVKILREKMRRVVG